MVGAPAAAKAQDAKKGGYAPSKSELARWYGLMHLGRVLDDKAPNYLKQAIGWS